VDRAAEVEGEAEAVPWDLAATWVSVAVEASEEMGSQPMLGFRAFDFLS